MNRGTVHEGFGFASPNDPRVVARLTSAQSNPTANLMQKQPQPQQVQRQQQHHQQHSQQQQKQHTQTAASRLLSSTETIVTNQGISRNKPKIDDLLFSHRLLPSTAATISNKNQKPFIAQHRTTTVTPTAGQVGQHKDVQLKDSPIQHQHQHQTKHHHHLNQRPEEAKNNNTTFAIGREGIVRTQLELSNNSRSGVKIKIRPKKNERSSFQNNNISLPPSTSMSSSHPEPTIIQNSTSSSSSPHQTTPIIQQNNSRKESNHVANKEVKFAEQLHHHQQEALKPVLKVEKVPNSSRIVKFHTDSSSQGHNNSFVDSAFIKDSQSVVKSALSLNRKSKPKQSKWIAPVKFEPPKTISTSCGLSMQSSTPPPPIETLSSQDSPNLSCTPVQSHVTSPPLTSTPNFQNSPSSTIRINGHLTPSSESPKIETFYETTPTPKRNMSNLQSLTNIEPFTWELYLKDTPDVLIAPREAFMQSQTPLINNFKVGMKLEARDPKKNDTSAWSLASVVTVEGVRVRLRFDGSDSMSDVFELIDSDNIRPFGSTNILYPPMAYRGNIATYSKFVEKVLTKQGVVIAPPDCFANPPKRPARNLFKTGMKLEALDRKNAHLIYPATVGEVNGDELKIVFDGWKGSFDYVCKYYSRDIFPINWCQESFHYISPPKGWEDFITNKPEPLNKRGTGVESPLLKESVNMSAGSLKLSQSPKVIPINNLGSSKVISPPKNVNIKDAKAKTKTPKKRGRKRSMANVTPESNVQVQEVEENIEGITNLDDEEDLSHIPKYQCQRALPYCDWLRRKEEARIVKPTAIEREKTVNDDEQNCSFISESSSLVSAISSQDDDSPFPKVKKLKTDVSQPSVTKKFISNDKDDISGSESGLNTTSHYTSWSVAQVLKLINSDETLVKYSDVFADHEIDGKAFVLLTTDVMVNHMGLKIGPVLKINDLIEQVKRKHG